MDDVKDLIKRFLPFAQEKMGFDRPPKLFLRQDAENAANPLGKTGFYDPQAESITIYVSNRHPKDILRSLSHELMHHTQKCNGDFDNEESQGMGEQGYAQNNIHMRTMEIQAYQASIVFRDWEDSLKETIYYEHLQKGANKAMSTKEWKNGEINTLLTEKWGFKFNLDALNEAKKKLKEDSEWEEHEHEKENRESDDAHIDAIRHHLDALEHDKDYEEDEEHIDERSKPDSPDRSGKGSGRNAGGRRLRPLEEEEEEEQGPEISEAHIREVARKVIARMKETNG